LNLESEMLELRLSSAARLACAAFAGLLVLSSASFAQGNSQQLFPGGYQGSVHTSARAQYPYAQHLYETPGDFSSSHVCVNGFRWITRNIDPNASAAQNAVPVRC